MGWDGGQKPSKRNLVSSYRFGAGVIIMQIVDCAAAKNLEIPSLDGRARPKDCYCCLTDVEKRRNPEARQEKTIRKERCYE